MTRSASKARSTSRKRSRSLSRGPSPGPLPVVVFNSPGGRAFRRVLKEESLNDFKRSIRAKLRLPESVRLYLAETREGRRIDLDDDDDFEAFQAAAELDAQLEVEVEVDDTDGSGVEPSEDALTEGVSKRRKATKSKEKRAAGSLQRAPELHSETELVAEASRDGSPPRGRSFHRRALDEDKPEKKHKEKGSKSKARASSPAPLLSQTVEGIELPFKKKRSTKGMSPDHLATSSEGAASSFSYPNSSSATTNRTLWDVPASEPAAKRKRKRTGAVASLPETTGEVKKKKKRTTQAIFDDDVVVEHIPTRHNAEGDASLPATATSQPRKVKKTRRAHSPFEPVVATQEGDTEEHNGTGEHGKKKKKRNANASDALLAENAIASGRNNSLGVPDIASSKKRRVRDVDATLSDRQGLPPESLSPMTRKVNELLRIVHENKPGLIGEATWRHQHADSTPQSSCPPISSEIQRDVRASARNAPQNSDITAETGRLQDVTTEEEHKSRKKKKIKSVPEDKVGRKTKKKERQPQNEYENHDGNKSSAADTRTDQVEHKSDTNSVDRLPPSSSQCREKPDDIPPAAPRSSTAIHVDLVDRLFTLRRSRNAIGSPSSSICPPTHPITPTIAALDAVELESLLMPSEAEKRKTRTSLEALFNRGDEDLGDASARDIDGDTSQDSEGVRSSTPSDARRGRKRNVRATTARVRPGFQTGSEDDASDSPDSVPNVPQTCVPQVGPKHNRVNPLPRTALDTPDDEPPKQSRDEPRIASEDATATAAEGDKTSLDGSVREQSTVIAGGRQLLRVTDGARKRHGVSDGAENASENPVAKCLILANTLSSRSEELGLNRQEADIESIDEFYTQQDRAHTPGEGSLSMSNRAQAPDSPIQPSSPWTPNDRNRSLFVGTSSSQITNHHQSSNHPSRTSPPPPGSPQVPTLQSRIMEYRASQAHATCARSSGIPVSVVINPGAPRQPMDSLTGRVESDGLKGPVSSLGAPEKRRDAPPCTASEGLTHSGTTSQNDPTPTSKPAFEGDNKRAQANECSASAVEPANGPRGDSVGSVGTPTPGPAVGEWVKWATSYLRKSGMTKILLREFFTHEGVPLGKKADTKEKLLLQAIELMKTHPNHYTRLKVRFDNAVKTNKAQLQELPPPMIPPSPLGAKPARPTSTDSSGDANAVDRSLLVQPADTSRALSGSESESESESEMRPNPLPANASGNGPRASMPVRRFSHSQPTRQSRPSAPILSLRNMTQDYVRSAIKPTAKSHVGRVRLNRLSTGRTQQQESDQDDEEESDDSSDAARPSQIPADRRAGAGLVSSAFKSFRNSMFLSQ